MNKFEFTKEKSPFLPAIMAAGIAEILSHEVGVEKVNRLFIYLLQVSRDDIWAAAADIVLDGSGVEAARTNVYRGEDPDFWMVSLQTSAAEVKISIVKSADGHDRLFKMQVDFGRDSTDLARKVLDSMFQVSNEDPEILKLIRQLADE